MPTTGALTDMKTLILDIETKPLTAHVWGLWKQNIAINQIVEPDGILCFAAKWHDERGVKFASVWDDGEAGMLRAAHHLLSEADAVIGWNSDRFDLRWLNTGFLQHGMGRPAPAAKVDLLKSVRYHARLPSYKLDYVAQFLGVGRKISTGGFGLWKDVMAGCEKARARMKKYNIGDVRLTDDVFTKLGERGWVRGLPNWSIRHGHACPYCGSERLQARGFRETKTRRYQRFQCRDCQGWSHSVHCEPGSTTIREVA